MMDATISHQCRGQSRHPRLSTSNSHVDAGVAPRIRGAWPAR